MTEEAAASPSGLRGGGSLAHDHGVGGPRLAQCFLFALLAVVGVGCGGSRPRPLGPPELRLERLEGGEWNLADEAGQVVVLHFFATFDGPSQASASVLERLHVTHQHQGVRVVGVAMDPDVGGGRRAMVETYAALNNLSFDIVLASDELGEGGTAVGRIPAIPATVVVDREGQPTASSVGVLRWGELEALVEQLLRD